MAQAFFAYRVQLPDGSEAIRRGGAERPPTFAQLADYAANQGERFLGPVDMSPAMPPPEPATPAAAPVAAAPPAAPAAPPPSPPPARPGIGATARHVFLPERPFMSEVPSIIGGTAAGAAVAPYAPWMTPFAAGAGSSAGEAGQVGLEQVMGWPPAEPGTLRERMGRAYARGAAGEIVTAPVRAGVRYAVGAVKPLLKSAEALKPVLTAAEPAEGTLAHWWQTAAAGGPEKVVQAWDALGETGQRALAGAQHGDMMTVVDTLRGAGGVPLSRMTVGQLAKSSTPGLVLTYAGHPYLGAGVSLGTQLAREQAPLLLLKPGPAAFLAGLPRVGRAAAPWASAGLRAAGQAGTAAVWPPPVAPPVAPPPMVAPAPPPPAPSEAPAVSPPGPLSALPPVGPTRVAMFARPEENLPPGTPPPNEFLARLLYPQWTPALRPELLRPVYPVGPGDPRFSTTTLTAV
jgi:hypothetical protein